MMITMIYLHYHYHYFYMVGSFALSLITFPVRIFVIDEFLMQVNFLCLIIHFEVVDLSIRSLLHPLNTILEIFLTLKPMLFFRQVLRVEINLVIYTYAQLFVLVWAFLLSLGMSLYY